MKYIKNIKEFFEFKPTKDNFNDIKSLENDLKRLEERITASNYDINDEEFEKIKSILESDCKDFINELVESKNDNFIFRGVRDVGLNVDEISGLYQKNSRTDRRPLDMYWEISELFDNIFEDVIGVPLRRVGVFTSKNPTIAGGYSNFKYTNPFIFFPINDYNYYWNPDIQDLYSHVEYLDWYYTDEYMIEDEWNSHYSNPLQNRFSSGLGNLSLNGVEIPKMNKDDIVDYICKNYKKYGLEPNGMGCYVNSNDIVVICDNTSLGHIDGLEWEPEIELDDYIKERMASINKEQGVRDIVNGYTNSGLEHVTLQEISFVTKKYYLIDVKYYFKLKEWLQSKMSQNEIKENKLYKSK